MVLYKKSDTKVPLDGGVSVEVDMLNVDVLACEDAR